MKNKKNKVNPICYWKGCPNKASYKCHPSKSDGHLTVCKEHFLILSEVYGIKEIGKEGDLTVVRILPGE